MNETLELQTEQAGPAQGRHETGAPPMMRGSVLLHTLRFTLDPEGYFAGARRRHGDMFTLRILGQRWVAVAHPDAVRELFSHGPEEVDSGGANQALSPVLGTRNLLLLDREEHLHRRRIVLPAFTESGCERMRRRSARRFAKRSPIGLSASRWRRSRVCRRSPSR